MKNVLIVSAYGIYPMLEYELDIIQTRLNNAHTVFFSYCSGVQKFCTANYVTNSRFEKDLNCKRCLSRVRNGLAKIESDKFHPIKREHYSSANIENINIDFAAISTLQTVLQSSEPIDNNDIQLMEFKKIATETLHILIELIEKKNINEVLIFNGRFVEYAPIIEYCVSKKLEYYTYEYPFVGDTDYQLVKQFKTLDLDKMSNYLKTINLDKNIKKGFNYLENRIKRSHKDISTSFASKQLIGHTPFNPLKNKKIITIFTSTDIEFISVKEIIESRFFKDQCELIFTIINVIKNNYDIYIRIHPNAVTDKFHMQQINNLGSSIPEVTIINATEKYDTYAIISKSDLVITFGSTVGIEAMHLGIPTITIGTSIYNHFIENFTKISSYEELNSILNKINLHFDSLHELFTDKIIEENKRSSVNYASSLLLSGTKSPNVTADGYGKIYVKINGRKYNFKSDLSYRILFSIYRKLSQTIKLILTKNIFVLNKSERSS